MLTLSAVTSSLTTAGQSGLRSLGFALTEAVFFYGPVAGLLAYVL
jgi:hypothetical protein